MESSLHAEAAPISIDMTYMGFQVSSAMQLGGGSCSSGSCGTGGSCAC